MLISDRDDKWTQQSMKDILGKDPATTSLADFQKDFAGYLANVEKDPSKRTFGGLKRGQDGTFDDASLINILTESTKDCAGIVHSGLLNCSGV
jgi:linoleate 10R-lipoxygenase